MNTVGKSLVFIALATFMVGAIAETVIGHTIEADAAPIREPVQKSCHENFNRQATGACASSVAPRP